MNARVERFSASGAERSVADGVIAGIRDRLAGSASLIVNGKQGFTRIGARLAQHVAAAPPRVHRGIATTRITARVPVLQDAEGDADVIERGLTRCNHWADAYRYVFDPASRTVFSEQHAIVHAGSAAWWTPLLATAFALQLQRADEDADHFAKHLKGRIASAGSPHILKFRRHVRPVPRLAAGPQSADGRGNRFRGAFEFDAIAEFANRQNAFSAGATAKGVAIDAPFDRGTALLSLKTEEDHPRAGPGLSIFLLLPIFGRFEEVARIAAWLNRREAAGELFTHGIGAWTALDEGEKGGLRHSLFVPKDAWASGLALNLASAMLAKLECINALLNPGVPEANVAEVVGERYRQFTAAFTRS